MGKEQKIQKKIIDWLEAYGFYVVKTIQCSKSGVPDILCCKNGKFVAIEVKAAKGKVSKIQEYNIKSIKATGGVAFVAYSLEDVKDQLR